MAILVVQRLALLLGRFLPKLGRLFGAAHFSIGDPAINPGSWLAARARAAPSTCRENMPCGVVVSTGSCRLRKCAPLASSCSINREQVTDGSGEAIEPDHDQGLARADLA